MNGLPRFSRIASLCVGLGLLGSATLQAQTSEAVTDPVGAVTYTFGVDTYSAVGFTLVRPSVFTGVVSGGSMGTVTVSGSVNFSNILQPNEKYYLEVTKNPGSGVGDYVGDRLDINVAATIAAANNSIAIDTASPNNTAEGDFSGLANYQIKIRPHWTLASIFGTGSSSQMTSATSSTAADQVHVWNGTGFSIYWFRQSSDGSTKNWRNSSTGTTVQDGAILPPGVGYMVKKVGSPFSVTLAGEVRTNKFVMPLSAGTHLLSNPYPAPMSPSDMQWNSASGFVSATSSGSADQIWKWNGTGMSIYWFRESSDGTVKNWRNSSTGTTDQTSIKFMGFSDGYFLKIATHKDNLSAQPNF